MTKEITHDVIIIGGSYAGLSAAMSLGRSLRNVLVVDSGKPCNASTPHSHNFLTQDGKKPSDISTIAKQQLGIYNTVNFHEDLAIGAEKVVGGFTVSFQSGKSVFGKKLIFATGIKDELLSIPGFLDCWGISVIHCPYCHGYEYKGKRTAILSNGENAMHYALLVSNLTRDLSILTNGRADFTEEQWKKLNDHHISVNELPIASIEHQNGHMHHVLLKDGSKHPFDAAYFKPPFTQQSHLPVSLGCELTEQGYVKVDAMQKTTVEGVFACGDNSSMMRSVANAVATGNFAGAVVNKELATEKF